MTNRGYSTIQIVAALAGLVVLGSIIFFNLQPKEDIMREEAEQMMKEGDEMMREGEEMRKKAEQMMDEIDPFFLDEEDEVNVETDQGGEFPQGVPELIF